MNCKAISYFAFRMVLISVGTLILLSSLPNANPGHRIRSQGLFQSFLQWNQTYVKPATYPYLFYLGTGQNWAMFAEIEDYHDTWFETEVIFPDGSTVREPLAHPSVLPPWQRFVSMRDLFFFETVTGNRNEAVLKQVCYWVARRHTHPAAFASGSLEVRLVSRWRPSYVYVDGSHLPYGEAEVYQHRFSLEAL